ncbi:hypothetical protein B0H17DRAFT_1061119, partial [Mycena rosella]
IRRRNPSSFFPSLSLHRTPPSPWLASLVSESHPPCSWPYSLTHPHVSTPLAVLSFALLLHAPLIYRS